MGAAKSKRGPSASTRYHVLLAAAERVAEEGPGATSMRDVARAAGIRISTLYYHCRSKDELYREVTTSTEEQLRAIVDEVLAAGGDFATMARKAVDRLFTFYLQNRHLAKISLRASLGDHLQGMTRAVNRWVGFMEGVMKLPQGRRAFKDVDPALLLITLDGLIMYHLLAQDSYLALFGKDVTAPEVARRTKAHITRVILRILGIE